MSSLLRRGITRLRGRPEPPEPLPSPEPRKSPAPSAPRRKVPTAYQVKLRESLDERTSLYHDALPAEARSILDVGCNLGEYTRRFADLGYWCLGIDNDADLVDRAGRKHRGRPRCGFMLMDIDPSNVRDIPVFDVTFLLSVQHHWLMAHGPEVAGRMLADVVARTRHAVIFETASRRERFGDHPPDFVDNDPKSVPAYIEHYLDTYVGDLATVKPLGKMPCVGAREPYRWNYALYR